MAIDPTSLLLALKLVCVRVTLRAYTTRTAVPTTQICVPLVRLLLSIPTALVLAVSVLPLSNAKVTAVRSVLTISALANRIAVLLVVFLAVRITRVRVRRSAQRTCVAKKLMGVSVPTIVKILGIAVVMLASARSPPTSGSILVI